MEGDQWVDVLSEVPRSNCDFNKTGEQIAEDAAGV